MEPTSEPPPENLGLIRTDLANERTLLAYGRTSLMVIATGVSLIKFLADTPLLVFTGWALIVLGAVVGVIGATRFARLNKRLHRERKRK